MAKRRNKPDTHTERFAAICAAKRPFKTEAAALEAADFGMLEHMDVELGVYQCTVCQQWHLTQTNET